jgi:hypothetical protein
VRRESSFLTQSLEETQPQMNADEAHDYSACICANLRPREEEPRGTCPQDEWRSIQRPEGSEDK